MSDNVIILILLVCIAVLITLIRFKELDSWVGIVFGFVLHVLLVYVVDFIKRLLKRIDNIRKF